MSLWLHGKDDFISEAGAMNVFIIKEAADGCESILPVVSKSPHILPISAMTTTACSNMSLQEEPD